MDIKLTPLHKLFSRSADSDRLVMSVSNTDDTGFLITEQEKTDLREAIGAVGALSEVLAALGVTEYADLATANAALAEINRTYYDTALGRLNQTDDIA